MKDTKRAATASGTTVNSQDDDNTRQQHQHPTSSSRQHIKDAVAGFCAGAFSKTAVAPIERVKLLMQLQGSLSIPTTSATAAQQQQQSVVAAYRNPPSAWYVARTVSQQQGILAFWRGNLGNVLMQAGSASLNFMLMDYYKAQVVNPIMVYTLQHMDSSRTMEQRKRRRKLWSSFLSGGLAGATATTVLYPLSFLRTRLAMDVGSSQHQTRLYPHGMRDVLTDVYQKDGIRGLFQGYGIALVGGIAYRALHLGGYDALKTEILRHRTAVTATTSPTTMTTRTRRNSAAVDNNDSTDAAWTTATTTTTAAELTWMERIVAAQCVSLVSATVMYPVDSVRRRLMMQAGIAESERAYRNSLECIRVVWTKEGIKGFFLGLGPNLVRSVGGALLLVSYDGFRAIL